MSAAAGSIGKSIGRWFSKSKKPSANKQAKQADLAKREAAIAKQKPDMTPEGVKKQAAADRRREKNINKQGADQLGNPLLGKKTTWMNNNQGWMAGAGLVGGLAIPVGFGMANMSSNQAQDPNAAGGQQAIDPNAPPPDPSMYPPNYGNASVQSSYADSAYGGSPMPSPMGSPYGSTTSFDSGYGGGMPYQYDPNANGGRGNPPAYAP